MSGELDWNDPQSFIAIGGLPVPRRARGVDYRGASFSLDSSSFTSSYAPIKIPATPAPRNKSPRYSDRKLYRSSLSPAAHVATRVVYVRLIYRARIPPGDHGGGDDDEATATGTYRPQILMDVYSSARGLLASRRRRARDPAVIVILAENGRSSQSVSVIGTRRVA